MVPSKRTGSDHPEEGWMVVVMMINDQGSHQSPQLPAASLAFTRQKYVPLLSEESERELLVTIELISSESTPVKPKT